MVKIIQVWILPLIISTLLFVVVRPALAQIAEQQSSLSDYLTSSDVIVGEETIDGYRQVYYEYQGQKTFITGGGLNNHDPVTAGKYIAYLKNIEGAAQIFLYNILSGTTIQLTNTGVANSPRVSKEGNVVWEGWVDENQKWQIFSFDGTSVRQITTGDLSINPSIEGDKVVYARRDLAGLWRGSIYSLFAKEEKDITLGNKTQFTKLKNGKIVFTLPGEAEEEFPLLAEDLFLLDLAPLATSDAPSTVSEADILQELSAGAVAGEATESGELQPATESSELN